MLLEDVELKKYEEKYRNGLFEKISKVYESQTGLISKMSQWGKSIDIDTTLPNIGITLNNKLIELQNEFSSSGTSIYARRIKGKDPSEDFITTSMVGEAVISDLINYLYKGITTLEELLKIEKSKSVALEQTSPFKRFISKIRSLFIPTNKGDTLYTLEQKEKIKAILSKFTDINRNLQNYDLKSNIVPSVVTKIRRQGYYANIVPEIVENDIAPDFQKLGLGNLIPDLQTALVEEYKKDLPNHEMYGVREEDIHLYVPNFEKKKEETIKEGSIDKAKIDELLENAKNKAKQDKSQIKDFKKDLKNGGIKLEEPDEDDLSL